MIQKHVKTKSIEEVQKQKDKLNSLTKEEKDSLARLDFYKDVKIIKNNIRFFFYIYIISILGYIYFG